jgi:hypothetical protein
VGTLVKVAGMLEVVVRMTVVVRVVMSMIVVVHEKSPDGGCGQL